MDEASNLVDYLPMSFKDLGEQEYISFLWAAFETNYDNQIYHFAFLAYHMLMMSFGYFNIWQIRRQTRPVEFEQGLLGFISHHKKTMLLSASPFAFSHVSESSVVRLFSLIGCDDRQIDGYRKLVDDRNDAAHANGNIFFQTQPEVAAKINQVLRAVEEIQTYFRPTIIRCYEEFLLQSSNPGERESLVLQSQIKSR